MPPRKSPENLPVPDFRALFETVPGLYLVLLPDEPHFTIAAVNAAYARATLTQPAEIIGQGLFEVFPDNPDDPNASGVRNLRASLQRVIATGLPDTMAAQKYDIRTPDSEGGAFEERYWSPVNTPVLDANGQLQFVIHRVEDITDFVLLKRNETEQGHLAEAERTRAEQMEAELFLRGRELAQVKQLMHELRESERRFRIAFDEAPIGMVLTTPEALILDANQAFQDMLGYSLDELRLHTTAHFTHPDDVLHTKDFVGLLQDRHAPAVIEKRYIRKDGRVVWGRASVSIRRDERGTPVELIGTIEDVTDRKRGEIALRQQWQTFDTALSNTPDFTYVFDLAGRFTYINRALLSLWQRPLEDAVGKNFFDLEYPPELAARLQEQIQQVIDTREPLRDVTPFTGPTGETRDYDYIFVPVFGPDGAVEAVAGSTRDNTDRARAEEQLTISNQALKRVNRELEEFAFVASHDLQEPLRMVNIYTQLILKNLGTDGEKLSQYAGFVQQGVSRMEALIHDLLTFSRTVHSQELPVSTVDLSASLAEAMSMMKTDIENGGALVHVGTLPTVLADRAQMTHVFQNLISNALKYGRKDVPPRVEIGAQQEDGQWIVSIRDNGIGFEPQYAERIFGLFKRLHTDEYTGTGLGLAICKRIVERYGGRIWAEGRPGEGAIFYFSLLPAEGD